MNLPMPLLPCFPLTYPAGSSSWNPLRFRIVYGFPTEWATQLTERFPILEDVLSDKGFMIGLYPATIGITHRCPSVETFLHPPTFFSALHLASMSNRPVLLASQPIVGADFLQRAIHHGIPFPKRIVWGTGGYCLPNSLRQFVKKLMNDQGVEFDILHCYGMAEVGHSLFCGMDYFDNDDVRYHQIASHFLPEIDAASQLVLADSNGNKFSTGDFAIRKDGAWNIQTHPDRLHSRVKEELESWKLDEWSRRTGYLSASEQGIFFQLRQGEEPRSRFEIYHHIFWHRFDGSFTMKPQWGWQTACSPKLERLVSS